MTEAQTGVPSQIPDWDWNKASSVTAREKKSKTVDAVTLPQKTIFCKRDLGG